MQENGKIKENPQRIQYITHRREEPRHPIHHHELWTRDAPKLTASSGPSLRATPPSRAGSACGCAAAQPAQAQPAQPQLQPQPAQRRSRSLSAHRTPHAGLS